MQNALAKLLRSALYSAAFVGTMVVLGVAVGLLDQPLDRLIAGVLANRAYYLTMFGLIATGLWIATLLGLGERR